MSTVLIRLIPPDLAAPAFGENSSSLLFANLAVELFSITSGRAVAVLFLQDCPFRWISTARTGARGSRPSPVQGIAPTAGEAAADLDLKNEHRWCMAGRRLRMYRNQMVHLSISLLAIWQSTMHLFDARRTYYLPYSCSIGTSRAYCVARKRTSTTGGGGMPNISVLSRYETPRFTGTPGRPGTYLIESALRDACGLPRESANRWVAQSSSEFSA